MRNILQQLSPGPKIIQAGLRLRTSALGALVIGAAFVGGVVNSSMNARPLDVVDNNQSWWMQSPSPAQAEPRQPATSASTARSNDIVHTASLHKPLNDNPNNRPEPQAQQKVPPLTNGDLEMAFAIGDVIKLAFYEVLGSQGIEGKQGHPMSEVVERTELSGEYIVHRNGDILVPLLGAVSTAGETPERISAKLSEIYRGLTGREARISLVIREREPIYISGSALKGGTFPYKPGMTVLHALAMAGQEADNLPVWQAIDINKEFERAKHSIERLARLLARRSVLEKPSVEGDRTQKPEAPKRLIELVGDIRAQTLIDLAQEEQAGKNASRNFDRDSFAVELKLARRESENLNRQVKLLEQALADKVDRFQQMKKLKTNNGLNNGTFLQVSAEVTDSRQKQGEVMLALIRTEQTINSLERKLQRLKLDEQLENRKELANIDKEIAEEDIILAAVARISGRLGGKMDPAGKPAESKLEILRRTAKGIETIRAGQYMYLLPGDLLQITATNS